MSDEDEAIPVPNFDELEDALASDPKFRRPEPLPKGTWYFSIERYEKVKSTKKGTPGYRITFKPVNPGPDVSPQELSAFTEVWDYTKREIHSDYWLTDNSMFMLRELFDAAGVDYQGRTFKQCMPDLMGLTVMASVTHVKSEKSDAIFANIGRVTAAS